ncbi:MAG: translocation/assembly module TamB domain-containing protein [Bacteroidota bacterium]
MIINTSGFQETIKKAIIQQINLNDQSKLFVTDSYFNLKGEVVLNEVSLIDKNLDTIINLESLKVNYFPFLTRRKLNNKLIIRGLSLEIDLKNQSDRFNFIDELNKLKEGVFFDELIISNSNLSFLSDTLKTSIKIYESKLGLRIDSQSNLNIDINKYLGDINENTIDFFQSSLTLKDNLLNIKDIKIISGEQFINGNINLLFNESVEIIKSNINFSIDPLAFGLNIEQINKNEIFSGEITFNGDQENLKIDDLNLNFNHFDITLNGYLKNIFKNSFTASLNISELNLDNDLFSELLKSDLNFDIPNLNGQVSIESNYLIFDLIQKDDYLNILDIEGRYIFDGINSFESKISFDINNLLFKDSQKIDNLKITATINNLNNNLSLSGYSLIKRNGKKINLGFDSSISNDFFNSEISILNEKISVNSKIDGNIKSKNFNVISSISYDGSLDSEIKEINSDAIIKLNLSDYNFIISEISLNNIQLITNQDEYLFSSLTDLNDLFNSEVVDINREYDFLINWENKRINITSDFSSQIDFFGFYENENSVDLNLNLSKLFISKFFEINKNPLSGEINSFINLKRDSDNRTLSINTNINNLLIKNYLIGDLYFNALGNTDYSSYALNFNIKNNNNVILESEGTVIAINEKPNFDIDLSLNNFNISFIEKIGERSLENINSSLSGRINLWGSTDNIQHNGELLLDNTSFKIPYLNIDYTIEKESIISLYNQNIQLNNISILHPETNTSGLLNGIVSHSDFKNWNIDLDFVSDRIYILNKLINDNELYYGKAFLKGEISLTGPTNQVSIDIDGATERGTFITIPRNQNLSVENYSFIQFIDFNKYSQNLNNNNYDLTNEDVLRSLDLNIDLELNSNALLEITIDPQTGSYISGTGNGNLRMEIDSQGKFNIYGDYVTLDGIYNFKDLALIDKKFVLNQGGSITWDGDPLNAQLNILATYEVPGGANPALLLDNPNFNKKIPANVEIKLSGNLLKPNNPDFEIYFPNTSSTATSEINYKLSDPEIRELQAISLLTQGIFINEVSVSVEGITNNIYEKVSDVFSNILGGSQGPLKVGLNYLQGDKSDILDIKTEDRFGVTLSTQISDKILFNGKIGVPIGGIEETLIIGDVQIDFILSEDGSLKAKVFNRENEFRYIGDKLGYTQGLGLSYNVDFQTFRGLIKSLLQKSN